MNKHLQETARPQTVLLQAGLFMQFHSTAQGGKVLKPLAARTVIACAGPPVDRAQRNFGEKQGRRPACSGQVVVMHAHHNATRPKASLRSPVTHEPHSARKSSFEKQGGGWSHTTQDSGTARATEEQLKSTDSCWLVVYVGVGSGLAAAGTSAGTNIQHSTAQRRTGGP